jgi:hypothetical protein
MMTVIWSSELPPSGPSPSLPQFVPRRHSVKKLGEVSKPTLTDAKMFGPQTGNHDSSVPSIQEDAHYEYDDFLAQGYI